MKKVETTKPKGKRGKNPNIPKPEEHEGMPHHQHCPLATHREYKNQKYHEEHQNDIARIIVAHPPKTAER
jgi:hypothetical protein